jgi:hypothetical protein
MRCVIHDKCCIWCMLHSFCNMSEYDDQTAVESVPVQQDSESQTMTTHQSPPSKQSSVSPSRRLQQHYQGEQRQQHEDREQQTEYDNNAYHQQDPAPVNAPDRERSRSRERSSSRDRLDGRMGRAGAPSRLYVAGLGSRNEVSEADLQDLFSQYGKVVAISLKGPYAFVEFETVEESENALKKLHNSVQFGGKRLTVEPSNDPKCKKIPFSPESLTHLLNLARPNHSQDRCYHCGKHGHWARECRDRSSKGDVCFSCNRPGHIARDCPNGRYGASSRRGGGGSYSGSYGSAGYSRGAPPASYGGYPPYDPYPSRYDSRRVDSYSRGGGY